jgi:hypothetical protein
MNEQPSSLFLENLSSRRNVAKPLPVIKRKEFINSLQINDPMKKWANELDL